ncbi:MAG: hypothetical protein V1688_04100 [bacterium]
MSNFKKTRKIIAKILIFSFSLLICFYGIWLLLSGVYGIWINGFRYLLWVGVGLTGVLSSVGIIGIIVSLAPKRRPPKILFYSAFLFLVIMIVSLLTNILPLRGHDFHFHALNQESLNSSVRAPSCAETSTERQKNNTTMAENKDATDNIETNTEENNEEETKITWKKYANPLYGFSFEYPDYLKITADESCDNPSTSNFKGCWAIEIESADYAGASGGKNVISGFYLYMSTTPVTNGMAFEEFRDYSEQFSVGEWRESNSRKFAVTVAVPRIPDPDRDIFDLFTSTLYNPNLIISMGISGTKENKEEMEMVLNHFMETLE